MLPAWRSNLLRQQCKRYSASSERLDTIGSLSGRSASPLFGLCDRKSSRGTLMAKRPIGGCRCGRVRYECAADSIAMSFCYCRDCQMSSGSAFGSFVLIPPGTMRLRSGQPKRYAVKTDSGRTLTREFCAECGSPLFAWTEYIIAVSASRLDVPSRVSQKIRLFHPPAESLPTGLNSVGAWRR